MSQTAVALKQISLAHLVNMNMIEIIGWIGTAAVLTSFLMRDMLSLRLMNICACLIWVSYGMIKQDPPIIVTNGSIILIHMFWLYKNYFQLKEYKNHE